MSVGIVSLLLGVGRPNLCVVPFHRLGPTPYEESCLRKQKHRQNGSFLSVLDGRCDGTSPSSCPALSCSPFLLLIPFLLASSPCLRLCLVFCVDHPVSLSRIIYRNTGNLPVVTMVNKYLPFPPATTDCL